MTDPAPGGHPHEAAGTAADPSMEDILASIRRILNEEDAKPAETQTAAEAPQAEDHGIKAEPEDDVLELDEAMMVEHAEPASNMADAVIPVPQAPAEATPVMSPAHAPFPMATPEPFGGSIAERAMAVPFPAPTLMAPAAAASAAASVGELVRTLASERSTAVHRGGPTIEDLVREEIRPLMKEWLDTHLAPMVERLVRAEIERVVNRMT